MQAKSEDGQWKFLLFIFVEKKDWQGWQSESASIAWFDWIWFLVTTILNLPGQVWKIDDVSRLIEEKIGEFFKKRDFLGNERFLKMRHFFEMRHFLKMGDFCHTSLFLSREDFSVK